MAHPVIEVLKACGPLLLIVFQIQSVQPVTETQYCVLADNWGKTVEGAVDKGWGFPSNTGRLIRLYDSSAAPGSPPLSVMSETVTGQG